MARHGMEAAIEKNSLQIAIISMAITFSPPGTCASGSKEESRGFSGRIQAGAGYVTSTDQLKKDADKRLDGLNTNADRFDSGIPLVLLDLRYTFASGRQLYFGTPMESGGGPAYRWVPSCRLKMAVSWICQFSADRSRRYGRIRIW